MLAIHWTATSQAAIRKENFGQDNLGKSPETQQIHQDFLPQKFYIIQHDFMAEYGTLQKSFHKVQECSRAVHNGSRTVNELVLYIGINGYK